MKHSDLFGAAQWVTTGGACRTPLMRGEFTLDGSVTAAEITVCGLGFFELYLNGRKVSTDRFTPANSDYHAFPGQYCLTKYGEVTSHRIYVMRYNVRDHLAAGANCIGAILAPGWYDWYKRQSTNHYGDVKFCFRLSVSYADGRSAEILSGDFLRWAQSPITDYRFHWGETQDYQTVCLDGWSTVGFSGGTWLPVETTDAPDTNYYIQECPADRVIRSLTPTLVRETEDGYIYDAGENISGTPVIVQRGTEPVTITMIASERLDAEGRIEELTQHGQASTFLTDGSRREYALWMTWNAFRYVMVSKNAAVVRVDVIHTDVPVTSMFRSDNAILNWLYETCVRTQLDNMHAGTPSDCPHIERLGYTGDGELMCETAMMLLDAKRFYRKWLEDISDCQDTKTGHVQYTAPYRHAGGGPGGWGCAIIEVPYTYYRMYGDKTVLEEFLPKALRYFDYLDDHSENGLVVTDQPGLWCLGDWCTPEEIVIPAPFVNNYFYIKSIDRALEICGILGRTELIAPLTARRAEKVKALTDAYYDPATGDFAGNVQGANAFALDRGLGDDRTMEHVIARYAADPVYDTGIFGTDILTRLLFERGQAQLAFDLLTSKGKYSFYNWMAKGCTTFPEYWTFKRSQNHPMFGAVTKDLFTYLLGIRNTDTEYRTVTIEPCMVQGMDYAEGYLTTPSGRIGVRYERVGGKTVFDIDVPAGMAAVFRRNGTETALDTGRNRLEF